VERALQAGAALAVLAALPLARPPAAALALGALAAGLAALPPPPPSMARPSFLAPRGGGRLLFHREGPTASVAVVEVPDGRLLYIDGFLSSGTSIHARYMRMLGHLPLLFAPEPRRALVIAFGTGSTAGSAALHGGAGLDVVELSPEVLEAAPLFTAVHGGVLEGPRTRLHVDDGRRFLESTRERFDAITLEPLLPCFPGAIALYSREFYALARERLTRGGALCQWLPAQAQSADETRSLLRSFVDMFPNATVWQYMGTLLVLGFRDACPVGTAELRERLARPAVAADLARLEVRDLGGLGAGLVLDAPATRAWAAGAPPVTDDRPLVEFFRVPKAPFTRNLREALASLEAHRASRGAGEGATEGGLSILYRAAFEPAQAELRLLIEELDR
jgi:spermidine synthase